jgi:hypothetical protein
MAAAAQEENPIIAAAIVLQVKPALAAAGWPIS